jgi:hypothetical protein
MADTYKLVIKLPTGGEFQGEGPEAAVKEDYARFLEAVKSVVPVPPSGNMSVVQPLNQPLAPRSEAAAIVTEGAADRSLLDRLFSVDRTGTVSLRALPRSERRDADTLLVLLYGFQALKGEHAVTSGRLMKAARQSGIQADRIDRILASQSAFVTAAGFKKGRRYGLNNPGARRAEEILGEILG